MDDFSVSVSLSVKTPPTLKSEFLILIQKGMYRAQCESGTYKRKDSFYVRSLPLSNLYSEFCSKRECIGLSVSLSLSVKTYPTLKSEFLILIQKGMYLAQCEFECEHTPTLTLNSVFRSERGSRTPDLRVMNPAL